MNEFQLLRLVIVWFVLFRGPSTGCAHHLLDEVDHSSLSVRHLPVKGQRLQTVIAWKRTPCAVVHHAAGLGVARHRLPPVCPFFVLWRGIKKEKQGKATGTG